LPSEVQEKNTGKRAGTEICRSLFNDYD